MNDLQLFEGDKLNALYKASDTLAKSSILPSSLRGKTADIFSVLVMGQELGIGAMQALNNIYIVQGRPSLKAELMLAIVNKRFPDRKFKVEVDSKNLVVTCTMARCQEDDGGFPCTWDMERAKRMELAGRDQWIKQPLTMLKWRAISECIRTVFPDAILGMYTPDEAMDIETNEPDDIELHTMRRKETHPEEFSKGPYYVFQLRKFRGMAIKDVDVPELESRLEFLDKKKTKDEYDLEEMEIIGDYLTNYETYQDIIAEGEE